MVVIFLELSPRFHDGHHHTCRGNCMVIVVGVVIMIIMDIAMMCKKYAVSNICVSSVLPRGDFHLQLRRRELNNSLRSLCDLYNFTFIDTDHGENRIVLSEHIDYDGVHLNTLGSEVLAQRFGSVLNRIHSC